MRRIYLSSPLEDIVTVEKLVTIFYFTYDKSYVSHGESHAFWEINYVDHGNVFVSCDGSDHTLTKGDLILLPPDKHHQLRADGKGQSSVFILSFEAQSPMLNQLGGGVFRLNENLMGKLNDLIRICGETYSLPMKNIQVQTLETKPDIPIGSHQMIRTHLEQLLILLMQEAQAAQKSGSSTVKSQFDGGIAERIMAMLRENVCGRLTLEDVQTTLGYGKTYLCNIFKKVYGTSITSYYNELKIEEAQRLLHEGSLTITEISERLCFSSPQYFSKRFSQSTGMSPQEFKTTVRRVWSNVIIPH